MRHWKLRMAEKNEYFELSGQMFDLLLIVFVLFDAENFLSRQRFKDEQEFQNMAATGDGDDLDVFVLGQSQEATNS
jgi:hypothetical protein